MLNAAQVNPGGDGTAGVLTINGSFTQATGGVVSLDLGGTGAGQYDQLHVNGAASLDGTLLTRRAPELLKGDSDEIKLAIDD